MKHFMPTMNKVLRKLIHFRYDTVTINECNTSCRCHKDLKHYKDTNGKDIFRLLVCVSCENKNTVYHTTPVNSAVNIRDITKQWISTQSRLECFKITSFSVSKRKKVRLS